ncbi:hypothetical protein JCGZ_03575 [Jatropha curcas]|uniref:Uncharacterized protein n=1 Tax=Jatropha curcas TaxID=180498 RepID=A0A067L1B8_JATCU|nr:hypothetical protein JCGZ_03575 [Jatropha curcas]
MARGTPGASSSAQPPVPSPFPSIPSSSTPFLGPTKSSPASQSSTALASSEPRNKFSLIARHETGGDKAGLSQHTGGPISVIETSQLLPTPMEVFTYTHTKAHDGYTFVDKCALGVTGNYSTARERVVSSHAGSETEPKIDDLALYLEAIGAKRRENAEEIRALRAHVDAQEIQLAELREHVMQMSDQHGAGTSSSDPRLTIDPHVSTTLHQPLSSPLDLDIVDDTLATLADTMTHPVDTMANPVDTTLDRVEDRHYRFDFGPF